jgi:hypothetical protein
MIIFDIPTTLLTSERVIRKVDAFWGGGEKSFREALVRREIASFHRAIGGILDEEQLSASVKVITLGEFNKLA